MLNLNPKDIFVVYALALTSLSSLTSYAEPAIDKQEKAESQLSKHDTRLLKLFQLESTEFNQLTFQQAINKVHSEYLRICKETNEEALNLTFKIPEKLKSENNPSKKFSLKTNFHDALEQLSLIYGMKLSIKDNVYAFTPYKTDHRIIKAVMAVHPDFDKSSKQLINLITNGNDKKTLSIKHLKENSIIIAEGEASSIEKLKDYINYLNRISPIQIITRSRLIQHPDHFKLPEFDNVKSINKDKLYTEDQNLIIMRKLAEEKDTHVITQPNIVYRVGEPSSIEIIQEIGPKLWTGIKSTSSVKLKGLTIQSTNTLNLQYFAKTELKNLTSYKLSQIPKDLNAIQKKHFKFETSTRQGQTQFIKIKDKQTPLALISIQHQVIDATGKPTHKNFK